MKCKHKREMYYENRLCRECAAERETQLLEALKKARKDIQEMLTEKKLLSPEVFTYLNDIIEDLPEGTTMTRILKLQGKS